MNKFECPLDHIPIACSNHTQRSEGEFDHQGGKGLN